MILGATLAHEVCPPSHFIHFMFNQSIDSFSFDFDSLCVMIIQAKLESPESFIFFPLVIHAFGMYSDNE